MTYMHRSEEDDPICQCCGYEGPTKKYTTMGRDGQQEREYCLLCASTLASVRHGYGREDATVLAHVCYIGNLILDEIRKLQK